MQRLGFHRLIEFLTSLQLAMGILWIGLVVFTVGLAILMYSRWGQSQPLRKCMALSLLAHLLLAGYATTIEIVTPVPPPSTPVFQVSFCDGATPEAETDGQPRAVASKGQDEPWAVFPVDTIAQPAEPELSHNESVAPTEPKRSAVVQGDTLPGQPTPARVPLVRVAFPEPKMSSIETEEHSKSPGSATALEAPTAERREAPSPQVPGIGIAKQETAISATTPTHASSGDLPLALTQAPTALPRLSDDAMAAASKELPASLAGIQANAVRIEPAAAQSAGPTIGVVAGSDGNSGSAGERIEGNPTAAVPTLDRSGDGKEMGNADAVPDAYRLRVAPNRNDVVERQGGSSATEAAVKAALLWLADNQAANGCWDPRAHGGGNEKNLLGHTHENAGSHAETGITGLALLAFLAAGHTHYDGDYQNEVRRGLEFLLQSQSPDGNLGGRAALYEFMYCHAMAACALSEAYGMTHDERLRAPVERAIAYTIAAQDPAGGGWRYKPGTPGDTSQMGWQLMAIKSADLAGIPMPDRTRQGIIRFLRGVCSGSHGGRASYRPGEQATRTMSAEALVCWQFLGLPHDDPAGAEAGDFLLGELPGEGIGNVYYWYYATLAMYQLQGIHWERWNAALQETLVSRQNKEGPAAGSWDVDELWGSHGGRVYTTALAALSLEVYYRFLPLYKGVSASDFQAQRPRTSPQR